MTHAAGAPPGVRHRPRNDNRQTACLTRRLRRPDTVRLRTSPRRPWTKDSREAMNENSDLLPNLQHEEFEMQMRGYSRRQVDEYVARRNVEIRDLEHRLARALDESEHLR